ncbi:TadE/TadG family type IV pilus assembly protein [Streptomyces sp. NPDC002644]
MTTTAGPRAAGEARFGTARGVGSRAAREAHFSSAREVRSCSGTARGAAPRAAEAACVPAGLGGRLRRARGDRGVSSLELAGYLPVLIVIAMAALQLGLVGYGANQAGTAARAAARAASQDGDGAVAGAAAVSDWLAPAVSTAPGPETTTARVTVHVPSVIPLFGDGWDVVREATMPTDRTAAAG